MKTIYKVTVDLNKSFNKPIIEEYAVASMQLRGIVCDGGSECHDVKVFNPKLLGEIVNNKELEFSCLVESGLECEEFMKSKELNLTFEQILDKIQNKINIKQAKLDVIKEYCEKKLNN